MCFSATASFLTAGMTATAGILALRRVRTSREIPLAGIPLVFAAQQAAEGALWLSLTDIDLAGWSFVLTQAFLFFALLLWPVYAPAVSLVLEDDPRRRMVMKACFLCGVGVASFFAAQMWTAPHTAIISGHHILYQTDVASPVGAGLVYLAASATAFLASSRRALFNLGIVVSVGSVIAHFFYYEVFVSVWCFFAAASSFLILAQFELEARRPRPQHART